MGKVKKYISLKVKLAVYVVICFVLAMGGSFIIGTVSNDLQDKYDIVYDDSGNGSKSETSTYHEYKITKDEVSLKRYKTGRDKTLYNIASYAQVVLVPLWVMLCLALTVIVFYNMEIKKPLKILTDASEKIADNDLDFTIDCKKNNELGKLCDSFEKMRNSLYENNISMWRSLEERKKLNAAFSHDLRTPLTVLRGYTDLLEKYIPEGKVSEQKLMSTISTMGNNIERLEHYASSMNSVQKLEDITPELAMINSEDLETVMKETAEILTSDKKLSFSFSSDSSKIFIDRELFMQAYENIVSNGARYAKSALKIDCVINQDILKLVVSDDGRGFSFEELKHSTEPFFHDKNETDKSHFGLGLYTSRIICEKHGGNIKLENRDNGGAKITVQLKVSFKSFKS